jgi:uncharacterized HAD superfamily protein
MMMIPPALIGFDIDGVVADTMEAFLRLARDDHGINTISAEDITEFDVEDCLDLDPSVVDNIFTRLMEEPVAAGLRPMRHAIDVLREFAGVAPLHFVTARPQKGPIEAWLRRELGPAAFRQTRLIAMGRHDNKVQYVKNLGLRYFIDDRAQTCLDLSSEGITSMVYSQPWNRGKHNLATVRNWLDIRLLCFN